MNKEKVLIIGAGLSGLYTALLLQDTYDVTVIEARERIGGRICNVDGHDMGPSWVWGHQKHILKLINSLGLELFEQHTQGLALYDAPDGVEKFNAPPSAPSYRVKGGMTAIITALDTRLNCSLKVSEFVQQVKAMQVKAMGKKLEVQTTKDIYLVDRVISTLPPRLAAQSIGYVPAIAENMKNQLLNIPTWMGYAAKCVITYPHVFWKENGLSGFTFSHLGPLSEIHDASTSTQAALFGFVNGTANLEDIKEDTIKQLTRLYGTVAATPDDFYMVDWKKETYTSTLQDANPLREHPLYGFTVTHFEDKMIFSGTESVSYEGGYLEGAVYAAMKINDYLGEKDERV